MREVNTRNFTLAQFCITFVTVDWFLPSSLVATAEDISLTKDNILGNSQHLDKFTIQELQ